MTKHDERLILTPTTKRSAGGRRTPFSNSKIGRGINELACLLAALAAALLTVAPAGAATAQDGALEPVVIESDTIERLTAPEMERRAASTVWDALKGEPGVTLGQTGGRGESTVSIRGSSRYQVGLYVDDVPVATAYRNEWDMANSMLFDVESIEVSKGYGSPLLASNNGNAGVVNIRTHKPTEPLELLVKYRNSFDRTMSDQGRMYGIRLGTSQRLFYLQAAAFEERRDFFTLPSSFNPGFAEDGGRRANSDFKNSRLNVIAGFTPTDDIDVMVGYVRQDFEKGQPVNAGPRNHFPQYPSGNPFGPGGTYIRLWRWPTYETERFYLNAQARLLDRLDVKLLAYYDKHQDQTLDHTDLTFSRLLNGTSTFYDQFTKGAQLRLGYDFNPAHRLEISVGWRRLSHKDFRFPIVNGNLSSSWLYNHSVEDYLDLGAEYTAKPTDSLTLVVGTSWTRVTPKITIERTSSSNPTAPFVDSSDKVSSNSLWNWQLGAFWDFIPDNQLFATVARKGRMPTMRERFYRNGQVPANPDLGPEKAMHYEIGYRGRPLPWLEIVGSFFYSDYTGKIASDPAVTYTRFINTDSTEIWGMEIGAQARFGDMVTAGASLSLLDGKNRIGEDTEDLEEPGYHGAVWASITPLAGLVITPQIDFQDGYYATITDYSLPTSSARTRTFTTGAHVTADLRVAYEVNDHLSFEAGARNIFDKLYSYDWYYPQPGRNFYLGVTAKY